MKIIDRYVYTFSRDNEPFDTAVPGEVLLFKTLDCYAEQIYKETQLVHELNITKANPATGPVFINDAEPGDVLVVDILDITVNDAGFACSFGETGPLHEISEVRTKIIPIRDGYAQYNDVNWPIKPMIGVIGTAPDKDAIVCGFAGNHGGNMDSNIITKGSRIYLPVRVPGALLQLGDIHATMGNGEICGTGIEISAEVLVKTTLIKQFKLNWPVTELEDWWYVNSTGKDYDESLKIGCMELCRLMKSVYNWDETDIFIYLSLQGSVEVNQGVRPVHGEMVNLRIGIPKMIGKKPLIK